MKTQIAIAGCPKLTPVLVKLLLMACFIGSASRSPACGLCSPTVNLETLAKLAASENSAVANQAIACLRGKGPAGLEALFAAHADAIHKRKSSVVLVPLATNAVDSLWQRLSKALDAVGQQRDCYTSRLFWFTDLERAKAAAQASGKPILSLRLLGRLDEEFSCANSRFFRTALYANEEVSRALREQFVLHWQSVRPAPRITIDFGDGRKVERTVTGNSIHYVLAPDGRPIDALPGLYGPKAFLRGLANAGNAARAYATHDAKAREAALLSCSLAVAGNTAHDAQAREKALRDYHRQQLVTISAEWSRDLVKASILASPAGGSAPLAKALQLNDADWAKIAALHADDARLDQASRSLMRAKNPDAFAAGRLAFSKRMVEDPLLRAIRHFERTIAEDTVRNEYTLHAKLHEWCAQGVTTDLNALNEKVYAELFLTPSSDPWLGLVPPDTYTALERVSW